MSQVFFSSANEAQFGSFHYPLGMINFTLSDSARKITEEIFAGKQSLKDCIEEEAALIPLAHEVTSLIHEMRHFFDAFGTLAGISLFSSRLMMLKEFIAVSSSLRAEGMHWIMPIPEWAQEKDCPSAVRAFSRRAKALDIGSDLLISPFTPIEIEGHLDNLKIELEYERGGKADAFPLRVGRIQQEDKVTPRTVIFPLGLETLMEGNAHVHCRTFVEHYFPKNVAKSLKYRIKNITALDENGQGDQRAAQSMTSYMVCDLLITRFLERSGIQTFPRDIVLALIDRALSKSSIRVQETQAGTTEVHIDRVGAKLVEILESEDPDAMSAGTLSDDSSSMNYYENLLKGLSSGGNWQSVQDHLSPASSVAIWESYMAKSYIMPLLRERLRTNNRAYRTHGGFVAMLQKIGLPPARVANGTLMLAIMPPRVQQAWWHQLMLGEILRQLVRDTGPVFCPRAHETLPGISTMNLSFEGNCQRNIRLGCGNFLPGHQGFTPKCLFEDAISICALKR